MGNPYYYRGVTIFRYVLIGICLLALITPPQTSVFAASSLTITPLTWNVIGLDSNNVNVGPNDFPVGARVCNPTGSPITLSQVKFIWDDGRGIYTSSPSADPYINLRDGTTDTLSPNVSLGTNQCYDAYFEVFVNRLSTAYDHTRNYHITETDSSGSSSTPIPRQLYVEHLISQSRNSVTDMQLAPDVSGAPGTYTPIAAGGTMTLMVGNTYWIKLDASTATNGYNQLESFVNFPNTIFQVLSASTQYSADTSPYVPNTPPNYNPQLYADGCLWDNNPSSPTYRSCTGVDGKAGGTITVTYQVKIISVPVSPLLNPEALNTLVYDFSGSSYHYNSDFSISTRYADIVNASIVKSFSPKTIKPNVDSTLTFTITNPGQTPLTNVNFADPSPASWPAGLTFDSTVVGYSGCNYSSTPSPSSVVVGNSGVSFTNISIAGNSTCTITMTVTAAAAGTYTNITQDLFIDSTTDTGSKGTDTLTVSSGPTGGPSSCTTRTDLATWHFLSDLTTVTLGANVSSASTSSNAGTFAFAAANGDPANGSWGGLGWSTSPTPSNTAPYFEFTVDGHAYGDLGISFNYQLATGGTDWGGSNNYGIFYAADGSTFSNFQTGAATKGPWQGTVGSPGVSYISGVSSSSSQSKFNINFWGIKTGREASAFAYIDEVVISGCAQPNPPTLSKGFSSSTIAQGSTSTLTFTITNPNGAPNSYSLSGINFSDVLPSGLTILNGSYSCGGTNNVTATAATNTISLTGGSLAAGGSCSFAVTVTGATAGNYHNITTNISSTESGPNAGGANVGFGDATLKVVAKPVIQKSFGSSSIFTGNTTPLSFTITNPDPTMNMTDVAFSDSLPLGLTVTNGSSSQCGGTLTTTHNTSPTQDTIALSSGSLAAGNSCTFSATVTGAVAGSYTNTTDNVSATASSVTATGNTATASVLVKSQTPGLKLTKKVGPSVTGPWTTFLTLNPPLPQNVYFQYTVENTGDIPLTGLHVNDLTIPGLDLSNCTTVLNGITLPIADASDDQIKTCVSGAVAVSTGGVYTNTANAASDQITSADSTATYATAGLLLTKSVDKSSFTAAGDVLTYTYTVYNNGSTSLAGPVTVSDSKITLPNTVSCPNVNTVGNLDSNLDPGEGVTCTATYTVVAADVTAGFVTNTATATAGGVNSNTVSKTVLKAGLPDLTIAKGDNVSGIIALGNSFNWTLLVANQGSADATFTVGQTILSDQLPAAANYGTLPLSLTPGNFTNITGSANISCSINISKLLTCTASGGSVTIGSISGSFMVSVPVTPTSAGSLVNTAYVDPVAPAPAPNPGPNGAIVEADESNNTGSDTVTVLVPNLGLAKTDGVTSVSAGGTTTYSLTVTNSGNLATSGTITVVDVLPTGLSIADGVVTLGGAQSANWGCSSSSNVITCTSNTAIAAGGTSTFTFQVNVAVNATGTLLNKAQAGGGGDPLTSTPDSTTAGNCTGTDAPTKGCAVDSDTVPTSDLTISKTNGTTSVGIGGTTTYTIRATNNGPSSVTGAVLADPSVSGLTKTIVACSVTPGQCVSAPTVLQLEGGTFTLPALASGQFYEITVAATVTAVSGNVTNNATIAPPTGTGNPGTSCVTSSGITRSFDSGTGICTSTDTDTVITLSTPTVTTTIHDSGHNAVSSIVVGTTVHDSVSVTGGAGTPTGTVTFSFFNNGSCTAPAAATSSAFTLSSGSVDGTTFTQTPVPVGSYSFQASYLGDSNYATGTSACEPLTVNQATPTLTTTASGPVTVGANLMDTAHLSGGYGTLGGTLSFNVYAPGDTSCATPTAVNPAVSVSGGGDYTSAAYVTTAAGSYRWRAFYSGDANNAAVSTACNDTGETSSVNQATPVLTTTASGPVTVGDNIADTAHLSGGYGPLSGAITFDVFAPGDATCSTPLTPAPTSATVSGAGDYTSGNFVTTVSGGYRWIAHYSGDSNNNLVVTACNDSGETSMVNALAAPTIDKAFNPASIQVDGVSTLTFTITNPNGSTALTGVGFSDTFPSGVVVVNTTVITNSCGGGYNPALTISDTSVTYTSGSLAAGASCQVSVNVTSSTAGGYDNSNYHATSTETGNGSNGTTRILTAIAPPSISKSFLPNPISIGGVSTLTFTISNPAGNPVQLTGVNFDDALPAGIVIPVSPTITTSNCGTPTTLSHDGGTGFLVSGATIDIGSACVVTVDVTGIAVGDQINSVTVASTNGGTGNTTNATLTVNALLPPVIAKSFSPNPILLGGTSTLTFTITNPAGNTVPLTGVGYDDALPAGVVIPASPTITTSGCGSPTTLSHDGGTGFLVTGATIGVGSSCTITVDIDAISSGDQVNSVTVSANSGTLTGNTASATLTVIAPPSITKSFGASSVSLNGTTTLTFDISNPNAGVGLSGVAFTDNLPAGLVVDPTPGVTNTCGGTVTATAGSSSISLSVGTLSASGSCSISVKVDGTTAGLKNNSVQITSTEGGAGNTSNASITVVAPPTIAKAFGAVSIPLNGSTSLSFTLTNPNSTMTLTGVGFSDTLPAGLVISTPNGLTSGCQVVAGDVSTAGTVTAAAGTNVISLSGLGLNANGTCVFSVDVKGTTAGDQNNVSGNVTSNEGGMGNTASASTTVAAPPSIAKVFNPNAIVLNGTTSLTFTITNPAANTVALSGVTFTDILPAGLSVADSSTAQCGGTLTTTNATRGIALAGASIATNGQCQFSVTVTGTASGSYTNTTGNVSSTNAGTGNMASADLTVATPPSITKLFGASNIALNGTTKLTFDISNPNTGLALTGVAFTDNLPAGLVVASTPNLSNTCGGTATATAGSGNVSLSGGTLAASGTCTVSVDVQGTSEGVKNNSVRVTSTEAGTGNTSSASITVENPAISVTKAVTNVIFNVNGNPLDFTIFYSITVSNAGNVDLHNVQVTDDLTKTFPSPATFVITSVSAGGAFTGNSSYDGKSDINLLQGNDTLTVSPSLGSTGTITLAVTVDNGGVWQDFTNQAEASGLSPINARVVADASTSGPSAIDPAVTKAVTPAQAAIGDLVTFTITVTNNGTLAATGVQVVDPLPSNLDYVSASLDSTSSPATLPAGGIISYDATTRTVQILIGPLAVTDKYVIDVVTRVNGLGQPPIQNTATVSADVVEGAAPDPPQNDTSTATLTITTPGGGPGGRGGGGNITGLPPTGFAPGVSTSLSVQPADKVYSDYGDVWLEIPSLGVKMPIVGVPQSNGSWDVSWLGQKAGWLQGTAFPSWSGNSVLTGHVYLSDGLPGPFVNLGKLKWGDQVILHVYGERYVYSVRQNLTVSPDDISPLKHEDQAWVTLLTCEGYDPQTNSYAHRVAVGAILTAIQDGVQNNHSGPR